MVVILVVVMTRISMLALPHTLQTYTHAHVHTHANHHAQTHKHRRIHAHTHKHRRIHTHTYTHDQVFSSAGASHHASGTPHAANNLLPSIPSRMHICITQTNTHTHTRTHTHTKHHHTHKHTHIHTQNTTTHTYTYTYTHDQVFSSAGASHHASGTPHAANRRASWTHTAGGGDGG